MWTVRSPQSPSGLTPHCPAGALAPPRGALPGKGCGGRGLPAQGHGPHSGAQVQQTTETQTPTSPQGKPLAESSTVPTGQVTQSRLSRVLPDRSPKPTAWDSPSPRCAQGPAHTQESPPLTVAAAPRPAKSHQRPEATGRAHTVSRACPTVRGKSPSGRQVHESAELPQWREISTRSTLRGPTQDSVSPGAQGQTVSINSSESRMT